MQDITRLLAVPLNSDGKIIGFLGVDNPRLHYEDHTLLSSIQYFLTDSLKAKERKARLQYMSYRDMLTALYNRNRYIQVLEGMQQSVRGGQKKIPIMLCPVFLYRAFRLC